MIYGPFSLTGATAASMSLKLWVYSESSYDRVCYMASLNGVNFYGSCRSGNSQGWLSAGIDLANVYTLGNLLGQPAVWVALWFTSDESTHYAEGVHVDDILVRRCMQASCVGGQPEFVQPAGVDGQQVRQISTPQAEH